MHCPFCQNDDTRVIDTRVVEEGMAIRRRRECAHCGERYNTYETAELKMPVMVFWIASAASRGLAVSRIGRPTTM